MPDAYSTCVDALRSNWGPGELYPGEVVDIMFTALDEEGDTTVPRTPEARDEAEVMIAMVFADCSPEPAGYGAIVSNALRAIEKTAS